MNDQSRQEFARASKELAEAQGDTNQHVVRRMFFELLDEMVSLLREQNELLKADDLDENV